MRSILAQAALICPSLLAPAGQAGSAPSVRVLRQDPVVVVTDVPAGADERIDRQLAPELLRCLQSSRAWYLAAGVPARDPEGPVVCVLSEGPKPSAALLAQGAGAAGLPNGAASPRLFVVPRQASLAETLWLARLRVAAFVTAELAGLEGDDSRRSLFVAGLAARLADTAVGELQVSGVEREACLRRVQERGDLMARFHGKGMRQRPEFGPEEWAIGWSLVHFLECREGGRKRAQVQGYAAAIAAHTASYETFAESFGIEDMAEFGAAWRQYVATLLARGAGWLERGGPPDSWPGR